MELLTIRYPTHKGLTEQGFAQKVQIPSTAAAVKNKNRSAIPLKGWKFAGWEGGLAPAQDRMPLNVEFTIRPANFLSALIRRISLRVFAALRVLCGEKAFKNNQPQRAPRTQRSRKEVNLAQNCLSLNSQIETEWHSILSEASPPSQPANFHPLSGIAERFLSFSASVVGGICFLCKAPD